MVGEEQGGAGGICLQIVGGAVDEVVVQDAYLVVVTHVGCGELRDALLSEA